jgi:hypothetical protein
MAERQLRVRVAGRERAEHFRWSSTFSLNLRKDCPSSPAELNGDCVDETVHAHGLFSDRSPLQGRCIVIPRGKCGTQDSLAEPFSAVNPAF